jgi:hypothetical protein
MIKNNTKAALKRFKYIMWFNNHVETKKIVLVPKMYANNLGFKESIRIMCYVSRNMLNILLMTLLFSTSSLCYIALSVNLENMGDNPYMNCILMAIAEIFACAIGGTLIKTGKIKLLLAISFGLTSIGLGLILNDPNSPWCSVFGMIGKFGCASADNLLYTLAGTAYPRVVQATGLGIALQVARVGMMMVKWAWVENIQATLITMIILSTASVVLPFFLIANLQGEESKKLDEEETARILGVKDK